MAIVWKKVEKTVNREGTTITYQDAKNPWLVIQSRKRPIPHANGIGTWDFTTYHLIENGVETKEFRLLCLAKKYAEELYDET